MLRLLVSLADPKSEARVGGESQTFGVNSLGIYNHTRRKQRSSPGKTSGTSLAGAGSMTSSGCALGIWGLDRPLPLWVLDLGNSLGSGARTGKAFLSLLLQKLQTPRGLQRRKALELQVGSAVLSLVAPAEGRATENSRKGLQEQVRGWLS